MGLAGIKLSFNREKAFLKPPLLLITSSLHGGFQRLEHWGLGVKAIRVCCDELRPSTWANGQHLCPSRYLAGLSRWDAHFHTKKRTRSEFVFNSYLLRFRVWTARTLKAQRQLVSFSRLRDCAVGTECSRPTYYVACFSGAAGAGSSLGQTPMEPIETHKRCGHSCHLPQAPPGTPTVSWASRPRAQLPALGL